MLLNYAIIPPGKSKIEGDVDNIILTPNDVYSNYKLNEHHWTTDYVWNIFLLKLSKDLQFDFNPDDFVKVANTDESGKFDLSYHIPKEDVEVDYYNITYNEHRHCKISELRYNHIEKTTGAGQLTYYHRLYLGCHKTSEIINEQAKTDKWLILNTDSLSIPLVPILSVYFRKILVLDNRNFKMYTDKIKSYFNENTSLIRLMIDFNWHNLKYKNNICLRK